MNNQATDELIQIIANKSRKLDKNNLAKVLDFVDFLANENEENDLGEGISRLGEKSKAFEFLVREPDIYSIKDVQ